MRPLALGLILLLAGNGWARPAPDARRRRDVPGLAAVVKRLFSPAAIPLLRRLGEQCWNAQRWTVTLRGPRVEVSDRTVKDPLLRALSDFDPGATSSGFNGAVISDLLVACAHEDPQDFAARFRARYGRRASALLAELERLPLPRGRERQITRERLQLYAGPELLGLLRGRPVSAPRMASFDRLVRRTAPGKPLAGYRVLAMQHLLGSTGSLLRALAAAGARPAEIAVFAKHYSENQPVQLELTRAGFQTYMSADAPTRDEQTARALAQQIGEAPAGTRFLVLDDGGHLLKLVHERFPQLADRVVGVEQTRRGANLLRSLRLGFPVVNVAESWAKLGFESPMIGRSVARSVAGRLARLRGDGFDPGRRILLVGYGAVGRASALSLRKLGFEVEVLDESPAARDQAAADGLRVHASKEAALRSARVVLSATGATPFGAREVELLPNHAVLINAGSQDSEFDPAVRRMVVTSARANAAERRSARFGGCTLDLGNVDGEARQDGILRTPSGKRHLLVYNGDVINFDGSVDPIPPRYIQLTRGLLYLGVLQAVAERRTGLVPLAEGPQRELVAAIQRELGRRGDSLLAPRF